MLMTTKAIFILSLMSEWYKIREVKGKVKK